MTKESAFDKALSLIGSHTSHIVSHLDSKGKYQLLVDGELLVRATINEVKPLKLPVRIDENSKEYTELVVTPGQAGLIIGPVDRGLNRAIYIKFAPI